MPLPREGMNGRFQSAACLVIVVLIRMKTKLAWGLLWCVLGVQILNSAGQGTAFTYQGSLNAGGTAANGVYDLRFAIYDNSVGNNLIAGPATNTAVAVSNGLFTVILDFGSGVFTGPARWVEIGVAATGTGVFTTLAPRQQITATPFAIQALAASSVPAGTITSSMLAPGAAQSNLVASGISGVAQGGVGLSEWEYASNLLGQGYMRLGKVDLIPESWRALTNGPALGNVQVPGRRDYAAVWTGTELMVWGGTGASGALNSGGRYNPTTDIWTPMSLTNAPTPQVSPAAAWTGTQLVVWGGNGPARGGRYQPATDTWLPMSETNAPSPRTAHSSVWSGTYLIIWGGYDYGGSYLNNGARYDPVADTWTTLPAVGLSVRGQHSAVWTGTEMIIWGGKYTYSCGTFCFATTNYDDGARYNPTSNTWQPMTTIGPALKRFAHSAVWTGSEMIVWGGDYQVGTFAVATNINSGGRYSPSLNQWTSSTSGTGAPLPRDGHLAHWTGSRMLIWGGLNANTLGTNFTDGALYNPTNNTWSAMNSSGAPSPSVGYNSVWTGTQMLVWGGESAAQPGTYPALGHRYAQTNDTWSVTAPSGDPSARTDATAVWAGTEMIAWGGTGTEFSLRTGGRLNPSAATSNMWSSVAVTGGPGPRSEHTAVWTGTEMIIWGGFNGAQSLNTGGRYNPSLNTWATVTTASAPTLRGGHVAVWAGDRMVVWGGTDGTNFVATGGRYNPVGNSWQSTSAVNAPSARADAAAVWSGTEMIVWGGRFVSGGVTNFLNTGGRYDPVANTWQALPTNGAPAGRFNHTAVWTGSEMVVWGGETQNGRTNSGARFQRLANQWVPISTSGLPASRSQHTAVWAGTQMLIWGGFDGAVELASGGHYDPVRDAWGAITNNLATPSIRQRHAAVWSGTEMLIWSGRRHNGLGYDDYFDDAFAYTPPRTMYLYLRP